MADSVSDDVFARLLNQMGIVTLDQIEAAMRIVVESSSSGARRSLADVLVSEGVITQSTRENVEKRALAVQQGGMRQVGPYKILKKLGEGAMGAVYLADDTAAGRKVALKILPKKFAADQDFLSRFRREAKSTGQLNHVNIVSAYTTGEELGVHYYAMEFCEGEALNEILKREKALPWNKAVDIAMQVARGLEHAHEQRLIHRDIKPSNIFITADGTAKILDLGLAKNIGDSEQSYYTQTGVALGTPHYISPEQARADKIIDGRTDIYSLGATLYHLVTGQTPFEGETPTLVMMKHLSGQLPNPQDIDESIPDGVMQVVQRMMAKEPADRYPGCSELLRDLELVLEGKPPSPFHLDAGKSSIAMRQRLAPPRRGTGGVAQQKRPAAAQLNRAAHRRASAPAKGANYSWLYVGAGGLAVLALILVWAFSGGKKKEEMASIPPNLPAVTQPEKTAPPILPKTTTTAPNSNVTPRVEAAPEPPPAPPLPPGAKPVDVLAEVDVDNDAFIGVWKMEKGALISPIVRDKASTIIMPYILPEHYRIDVEVARLSGSVEGFVVGMTTGRNPFAFNLDDGKRSYLLTVDGQLEKPFHYNKTTPDATFADGPLIKDTKPHHLCIEMGRKALTVSLDNKMILNWKADYMRLGPSYWNRISKRHLILAARESVWRITKVQVLDLEGKGEINHVDMRGVEREGQ